MLLFAAATPVLLVTTLLSAAFVVPPVREPATLSRGTEIRQGLKDLVSTRAVLLGVIAYMLVFSFGDSIMPTVSLMATEVLAAGEGTVGYQNELRFGFKAVAGVLLGWLLSRTNAKATVIATTLTVFVALIWALSVSGTWYLVSMGLLGAGELLGAYFPNYVASASPRLRVRLNIAYLNLIGALAGFAPLMYGAISDRFDRRTSLYTAAGALLVILGLMAVFLPANPRPEEERDGILATST